MQNALNANGHCGGKNGMDLFADCGDVLHPVTILEVAAELFIFSYLKQGWQFAHNRRAYLGLMQ